MLSTSSALSPPDGIDTVNVPVSKFVESTSATTALPLCSITTAPSPSLYARLSPLRFVIVGASLAGVVVTVPEETMLVPPSPSVR
jgi:hypothetical protein